LKAGHVLVTALCEDPRANFHGRPGVPVERDQCFECCYPLSVYARAVRRAGCIVTDKDALEMAEGGVAEVSL
jgi:hypothetical protein